jgi:hypothetical protein
MEELPKPAALHARGGCWFRAGGQELHVGVEEPFVPAGNAHPGLVASDLAELRGRLDEAGDAVGGRRRNRGGANLRSRSVRQPAPGGRRVPWEADDATGAERISVHDPSGNRFEVGGEV